MEEIIRKGNDIFVRTDDGVYKLMRIKRIVRTHLADYYVIDRDYFLPEKRQIMFAGVNSNNHLSSRLFDSVFELGKDGIDIAEMYGYRLIDVVYTGDMAVENLLHDVYVFVRVHEGELWATVA